MEQEQLHYLEALAERYPTIRKASAEIINLQAILNLPKGTEHFLSDIHGEWQAFSHVLKNGSGAVRKKIDDVFGDNLAQAEKSELATLIYYPREKMELVKKSGTDMDEWYRLILYRLIEITKTVSSKYTRSKVRRSLPEDYAYIIEELINEKPEVLNKEAYYDSIVNTIVELARAEDYIGVLADLIQRLSVDHLHVLGDIYDRGSGPHLIMDRLCSYHSLDIQWGNHDIIWMGAAAGQLACVATVVRNSIRYGNLDLLEEGYGINMLPLASFALNTYGDDPCTRFTFKMEPEDGYTVEDTEMIRRMHKAIAIIRFKLEGQLIAKYPSYGMDHRKMLERVNYEKGTVNIDGVEYDMLDMNFPTVDPANPCKLTDEEMLVMNQLRSSFLHCEKLQRHIRLMLKKGGMYRVYNGNLLFHGCVPLAKDGSFAKVDIYGKEYSGKALFDILETYVRKAFFSKDPVEKEKGADIMWYIWTAPYSPLYGREKIATFERYFVDNEDLKVETKNLYFERINTPALANRILAEFGLTGPNVHIINGHVPVHRRRGESPVKCGGKVIVIDGGFSKAYRKRTGIAGYTLIYNSYGLTLTAHEPFDSPETAVRDEIDIVSKREAVELMPHRMLVGDTDIGKKMQERIRDIKLLIEAYQSGELSERSPQLGGGYSFYD